MAKCGGAERWFFRRQSLVTMASPLTPLSRLFTVVLAGVLAGLVLAVAALPGNLLLGVAAQAALGNYAALPDALRTPATPQRVVPLRQRRQDVDHHVLRREPHATWRWTEVAPVMRQAIVAAEDRASTTTAGSTCAAWLRALVANVTRAGRAGRLDADHAVRAQRAEDRPEPHGGGAGGGRPNRPRAQDPGDPVRHRAGAAARPSRRSSAATSTSPTSAPGRTGSPPRASATSPRRRPS